MSINEQLTDFISTYEELKTTEQPHQKKIVIEKLRTLGVDVLTFLKHSSSKGSFKHKRQIEEILTVCNDIEEALSPKSKNASRNGSSIIQSYSQQEIAEQTFNMIVRKTINSAELRLDPEEIKEIIQKLRGLKEMEEHVSQIMEENDSDLIRIESFIDTAFNNVAEADQEIDEAKRLRHQTIMLKLRTGISSILGLLGYLIFGIPGMVGSFLVGLKFF